MITGQQVNDLQATSTAGADICADIVTEVLTMHPTRWPADIAKPAAAVRSAVIDFALKRQPACQLVLQPARPMLEQWWNYEDEEVWSPLYDVLVAAVLNADVYDLPASLETLRDRAVDLMGVEA